MQSNPGTDGPMLINKVFGLGLARTGTTSLHQAMGLLELNSAPDSIPLLESLDLEFLGRYDAFFDNPIPFRYRELDLVCSGSRWIVTQRPLAEWLDSMRWLFGPGLDRLAPEMRAIGDRVHRHVYGTESFDSVQLSEVFRRHYADLAQWVKGRNAIWIHVEQGIRWEPICELLEVDIPEQAFPHTNRRGRRRIGPWGI